MLNYYNPITDKMGNIHSIDMVYCEYYSYVNPEAILEVVRRVHEKYPTLKYQEHLDRAPHSKYDYYLNGVAIGGAYVSCGKYNNYDKMTKTFDLLPMFELRVNPNKYMYEQWFQDLLSTLLRFSSSGVLRKYDYAVDIPLEPKYVEVLGSRKEPGLYKGTRYYGQDGRHGYLKVYDKQKDMARQKVEIPKLTRVEHTLFTSKEPSLENIYIYRENSLKTDLSSLNDTDKAIVEMYLRLKALGIDYDLRLGRGKMEKLKEYISGQYVLLEYGSILNDLLSHIKKIYNATDIVTDDNGFLQVEEDEELPFE